MNYFELKKNHLYLCTYTTTRGTSMVVLQYKEKESKIVYYHDQYDEINKEETYFNFDIIVKTNVGSWIKHCFVLSKQSIEDSVEPINDATAEFFTLFFEND